MLALIFVLFLSLIPKQAFAEYLNSSVDSTVSIQTNGSMRLVEQRTMSFDESYSAVSMRFAGLPSDAEIDIMSVRLVHVSENGVEGEWITLPNEPFQSGWREAFGGQSAITSEQAEYELEEAARESANSLTAQNDSWSLDERDSALYVFYPFEGNMLIEVDVAISNVVFVYDDVAEFYWDYISADSSAETNDVSVTVQLPVPEGIEVEPGKNVLAWGHGPAGTVNVTSAGTIEYNVPEVKSGQYALAHILFPQSWLTNLPREMQIAYSGTRRDAAIAAEQAWTDTWSNSRINALSIEMIMLAISFVSIATAVILYLLFGREKRVDRTLTKCSILDSDPAVIGRLMRWNQVSSDDLVASMMGLSVAGAIQIEREQDADSTLGAPYGDMVIRTRPEGKSAIATKMDKETMRVLFGVFADGYQKISIGEILKLSKADPELYEDTMDEWQRTLSEEVKALALFDERSRKLGIGMLVACLVFAVMAMICMVMGAYLIAAAFGATFLCLGAIGNYMPCRSDLGIELSEKMDALMNTVDETDSISGEQIEPYIAYLFAAGKIAGSHEHIEEPTPTERVWLSSVRGRGGKKLDVPARRVSDALDVAYQEACN